MRKIVSILTILFIIYFLLLQFGCGGGPKLCKQSSIHDTAENHYYGGRRSLNKAQKTEAAMADFERALCLTPDFAPAYEGIGLYHFMNNDYVLAKENFDLALAKYPDWIPSYIGLGRIAVENGNFAEAHKNFEKAAQIELSVESGITDRLNERTAEFHSEAMYYNGLAYFKEKKYKEAEKILVTLREQDDASTEFKKTWQDNKLAMIKAKNPGSNYEGILLKDIITRQDLAAVIFKELPAAKIYKMRLDETMMRDIVDIDDAWAKDEIKKTVESKMLVLPPNGMFNPSEKATKADLAQALLIAFANANKDESLLEKYENEESPFYDVPTSHPAYNGIMFATKEGFMTPAKSTFGYSDEMSGSELFWIFYKVNLKLN